MATNEPIKVGEIEVKPGDYAIADGSGVVFISAENIERVVASAEEHFAREAAMAQALREGKPITEVMGANYENMLRNRLRTIPCQPPRPMPSNAQASSTLQRSATRSIRLGIAGPVPEHQAARSSFSHDGPRVHDALRPVGKPAGTVGDFIDDVAPGSVVAIDNGGRENATVWGDILTEIAHRRGIAGTVIDGACRDTALCLELGYPVFSKSYSMRTGKDRVQLDATNIAVNIGDARVAPGDILRGDADGVVAIPRQHEAEVLATAEGIPTAEEAIRNSVRGGKRLDEARKEFGYHQLQTKRS